MQQLNPGDLEYILDSEESVSEEVSDIKAVEKEVEEAVEELQPDVSYKQEDEITYFGDPM